MHCQRESTSSRQKLQQSLAVTLPHTSREVPSPLRKVVDETMFEHVYEVAMVIGVDKKTKVPGCTAHDTYSKPAFPVWPLTYGQLHLQGNTAITILGLRARTHTSNKPFNCPQAHTPLSINDDTQDHKHCTFQNELNFGQHVG